MVCSGLDSLSRTSVSALADLFMSCSGHLEETLQEAAGSLCQIQSSDESCLSATELVTRYLVLVVQLMVAGEAVEARSTAAAQGGARKKTRGRGSNATMGTLFEDEDNGHMPWSEARLSLLRILTGLAFMMRTRPILGTHVQSLPVKMAVWISRAAFAVAEQPSSAQARHRRLRTRAVDVLAELFLNETFLESGCAQLLHFAKGNEHADLFCSEVICACERVVHPQYFFDEDAVADAAHDDGNDSDTSAEDNFGQEDDDDDDDDGIEDDRANRSAHDAEHDASGPGKHDEGRTQQSLLALVLADIALFGTASTVPKSVCDLLVRCAELMPALVYTHLLTFKSLLESSASYAMRSAVVSVLGTIICSKEAKRVIMFGAHASSVGGNEGGLLSVLAVILERYVLQLIRYGPCCG